MAQLLGEHFLEAADRDGGEAGRKLRYSEAMAAMVSGGGGGFGFGGTPPPPAGPAAGTAVEVVGLVGAQQHNGKRGVVAGMDLESGRCKVRLDDGKMLGLKPENLKLVPV